MFDNKTCNKCKHAKAVIYNVHCSSYECTNPNVVTQDIVTGKTQSVHCRTERQDNGRCKPEGLLYEERETVLEIVERIFGKRP